MIERGVRRNNSRCVIRFADRKEFIKLSWLEIGRDFYYQRSLGALGIDRPQQLVETLTSLQLAQTGRIR